MSEMPALPCIMVLLWRRFLLEFWSVMPWVLLLKLLLMIVLSVDSIRVMPCSLSVKCDSCMVIVEQSSSCIPMVALASVRFSMVVSVQVTSMTCPALVMVISESITA